MIGRIHLHGVFYGPFNGYLDIVFFPSGLVPFSPPEPINKYILIDFSPPFLGWIIMNGYYLLRNTPFVV